MAKDNIANHSLRLNLNNEQHLRVHKVLKDLNISIHKSLNQFLVEAVDFYVKSFNEEDLTNQALMQKQEGDRYITRVDLLEIKKEIHDEVKDEIIRLFGIVMTGGQAISLSLKGKEDETRSEEDSIMLDLADRWG